MHTKSLVAAFAGASLLVAGCGSAKPPTTGSSSLKSPITAAYKFSACMRAHGVTGFPDPRVTSRPGEQAVGIRVTPALTGSPQFKSAQSACQGIMPAPQSPAEQAAQQRAKTQKLLAFARCVRAHGVTSFPDPTVQGQINPQMLAAAGVDLHAPGVIAAARVCVPASGGAVTQAAISQATGGR
ncbi:MAG: hypothetical protein QOE61_1782 [Micromonosporaceae bacterium]|nr:hypothetical protein [Micromonosporaceae bacterium]